MMGTKRPRGQSFYGMMGDEWRTGGGRMRGPKRPRFENVRALRGKPHFYVDDAVAPIPPHMMEYRMVPWLHKGSYRLQATSREMRRKGGEPNQTPADEGLPDLVGDDDDWRFDDPRTSRGPGGSKKKRRRRNWNYNQPPTDSCKPRRRNHKDDQDEDPRPPRYQGRNRCHSNVMINQNVRVNH